MDIIIPAVNPARLEPVLSELVKTTRPPFRLIAQCDSVSAAINPIIDVGKPSLLRFPNYSL